MTYTSIFRPDLFKDKVIIVTGGGTGIGRCIAHELASLNATVALGSRKVENPEAVRDEIIAQGGAAYAGLCNIRVTRSVEDFVGAILEKYGRIDGLVNNGGGQFMSPAEMISDNGWNAVLDTNLTGTWNITKIVHQQYMRDNGGAIVNITMENRRGFATMAHSGAARAGVQNLTKTLAVEWAQYGIRLNSIAPGVIESSGLNNYPDYVQEQLVTFKQFVPAKRFGTESEVSSLVTFLLSPGASYISGETIWVDGAQSLWSSPYPIEQHDKWETYNGFEGDED